MRCDIDSTVCMLTVAIAILRHCFYPYLCTVANTMLYRPTTALAIAGASGAPAEGGPLGREGYTSVIGICL